MLPEPSLMYWILLAPLLLAVVDLVRTLTSLKNSPASAPGQWSKTLGIRR